MLATAAADIFRMRPADSHGFTSLVSQYLFMRFLTVLGMYNRWDFEACTKDIARTQEDILMNNFIRPNADTEFGRKYDFKSINSREEFRRRVPLTTYEDYAQYIERIQTNEADLKGVLTHDTVVYLAITSGSTGRNKVIPVGTNLKRKSIRLYTVIMDVSRRASGGWQLLRQATLGYKPAVRQSPSGLPMGPISYHMNKHMYFNLIPKEVYEIEDEQTALYVEAVVLLADRELGYLNGFMSTLVWAFWMVIEQNWAQICSDIEGGVISNNIALEPYIRLAVEKHLVADPRRAEELREEFKQGTVGLFQRVWPRFKLLIMFTTGGFKHYSKLLVKNPCHGIRIISTHYGASEGVFGLQINDDLHANCLTTQYAAFIWLPQEYIPITDEEQGEADTVFVEQQLSPSSQRADQLRSEFSVGFTAIAQRVWPKLVHVEMVTSGTFACYAHTLRDSFLQGIRQCSMVHAASEAFIGVNIGDVYREDPPRYVLCTSLTFFEFISMHHDSSTLKAVKEEDEEKKGNRKEKMKLLYLEELKVGHCYEVVSTTPMGLYRYRMGDVIKVVGFHNQCPIYEFQYRTGHVLNVYWEKTPENVVYEAVHSSLTDLNLSLIDYTTTEDVALHAHQEYQPNSDCRHYILFLEVNRENGSPASLSKHDKALIDTNLRSRMELYSTLRETGSIGPMHVIEVMPGTFRALRTHMLGKTNSIQLKMPRVIRNPELLSLILSARHKEDGG